MASNPRFRLPEPPDREEASLAVEAAKHEQEFDAYLTDLLLKRSMRFYRDRPTLDRVRQMLQPQVTTYVNARLIDCICSVDPLQNHKLRRPKNAPYVREDSVQFRVKELIRRIYPRAHNEFIRQKLNGCMITIEYVVGQLAIPYV